MDRTGKKFRFKLPDNIFYKGVILEETEFLITIRDKFDEVVTIGTNSIIQMEEVKQW